MKLKIKIILVTIGLCLSLFQLAACSTGSDPGSTSAIDTSNNPTNSEQPNDVVQMQKEVPFTIILPEYLPDELKSLPPKFVKSTDPENQSINLVIYYYSSTSARQIQLNETIASEVLSQDFLIQVHPDYTPLNLSGVQVLEKQVMDEVIRSDQSVRDTAYYYICMPNNVYFFAETFGFDQTESRKIIQSMIP